MTSTPETAPAPEPAPTPDTAPTLEPIDEATARELALAALREITPAATIGAPTDATVDDEGVLTLRFANRMAGYPGWFWTVSLAQVEDAAPTVLEVELVPGDGALTAPEWLPWAERLAEYEAAQAALAAEGLATDDLVIAGEDDEDLDDVDDLDASDFDNDGSPILHSGDVDGVDIDELSEDADDDVDFDDPDDSDDEAEEDDSDDEADEEDEDSVDEDASYDDDVDDEDASYDDDVDDEDASYDDDVDDDSAS